MAKPARLDAIEVAALDGSSVTDRIGIRVEVDERGGHEERVAGHGEVTLDEAGIPVLRRRGRGGGQCRREAEGEERRSWHRRSESWRGPSSAQRAVTMCLNVISPGIADNRHGSRPRPPRVASPAGALPLDPGEAPPGAIQLRDLAQHCRDRGHPPGTVLQNHADAAVARRVRRADRGPCRHDRGRRGPGAAAARRPDPRRPG